MKTMLLSAVLTTFGVSLGEVDELVRRKLASFTYPQGRTSLIVNVNAVENFIADKREHEKYRR